MVDNLKEETARANKQLVKLGLVKLTFGNLSAINDSRERIVIKPSGVDYARLKTEDIVVLDLLGNIVEGTKQPSSDTKTHLELYKSFPDIGSVVHTHSPYATMFAQARMPISCLGTTHADYFHGPIPVTRDLTKQEIQEDYETNVGKVIVETFRKHKIDPSEIPACLVAGHGPFAWGTNPRQALENAYVLEAIAEMNLGTIIINPKIAHIDDSLLEKHFKRKHGDNAYYGQKER